ncbi:uncharacterized protein ASCRUDRAFT_111195 [Ascoidea rubescens DSM 1968]|uniref:Uncharacterized protein n=1 Tax=Ascoidea rubescens DSM 1968 TaxID=1344418 RepID=A0A1D2VDK9_9ASCO|nr:hypothetical protein ASCRUDRAFT_111195 [Ascoidea rubescens DSM 1968]ODV59731.1 hypothetical protein ASCRUDRAFT_111195 [Ascoidea rubescens DSM 1968]
MLKLNGVSNRLLLSIHLYNKYLQSNLLITIFIVFDDLDVLSILFFVYSNYE